MSTVSWAQSSVFYHIYPLGLLGAPRRNDFGDQTVSRLKELFDWLPHIKRIGCSAIYIGPVFESSSHGYDTVDYYKIDRRLGSNRDFADFVEAAHAQGLRIVVDGVFNHVGRDFPVFKNLRLNPNDTEASRYFAGFDPNGRTPLGDDFSYDTWAGHYELVRLNLSDKDCREMLLHAAETWIRDWDIDGIRLDAADCVDLDFQRELVRRCRAVKPDFWLMGEIVMGDYRAWAGPGAPLDSVTNYEMYKSLWSSHKDRNFHEIAWTLDREFGHDGLYKGMSLYNFADNHDVNRVVDCVTEPAQLYSLYATLFTVPGIPSLYYGSEWGISGQKTNTSDAALRPHLTLEHMRNSSPHPDLIPAIQRFAAIRAASSALRNGVYRRLYVSAEQIAFERFDAESGERVVVLINGASKAAQIELQTTQSIRLPAYWDDLLSPGFSILQGDRNRLRIEVPACWARILRLR